ncbi:MAG TPA: hypothetical protein VMD03_06635 [Steroidobacteraceae bacterium]|nr:hypothetical protein [Steroidobacteraceae bacterium]
MARRIASILGLCAVAALACAQAPTPVARSGAASGINRDERPPILRPGLFFKEEWQQTAAGGEHPVTADSNDNPQLDLELYVPAGQVLLTGSAGDENFPIHLWTGLCTSPCAVALRDRGQFADLSGLARIRLNTKMSGWHQVHPIVKLADGTWWVGDHATGTTRDWLVSEISYADLRWLKLDITRVVTVGNVVDKIDLTKVDEIGFADLMPASGHGPGGWADVAQIEVYGRPVSRESK